MASPQLMTYAELAEVWGVSKEAARKKVEGLRLPKQMGNDGRARVMVDLTEVQHEPMKPKVSDRKLPGDQPETTPETGHLQKLVSTLEVEVSRLTAQNATTRSDLEREQGRADELTKELATVREALAAVTAARDAEQAKAAQIAVLDAVLDLERKRIAEIRAEADRWREAATAPRGLWAWLKSGSR